MASPSANYTFSGWIGDLSGSTNPATLHPVSPHKIPVKENVAAVLQLEAAGVTAPVHLTVTVVRIKLSSADFNSLSFSI